MAPPKKTEEKPKELNDKDLVGSFLKENKDSHFNFLEHRYWKISTGSLLLDSTISGVTPGLHRFFGKESGGKTSEALEVMRSFLADIPTGKGVFFSAEGRLTKELRERCGLKFVFEAKDWEFGTILVIETNVYECVAQLIDKLIRQEGDAFYGIVVDSIDGLALKADLLKPFEDAAKVAGGAVIASLLMKRIAIPLAKRGHMAIFISQVRSDISIDPYAPKVVRQISATGGNALLHYSNLMLQFEPRFRGDLIATKEKEEPSASNPLLGHWAKVIVKKSGNETLNYVIRYPIKYGAKGASSIWVSKEIVDSLLQWEELERSGAWYNFSEEICAKFPEITKEKFQGLDAVFNYIDANPNVGKKLFGHMQGMATGTYTVAGDGE